MVQINRVIAVTVCALCAMLSPLNAMEFGVDRPGGDYKNFNLSVNDPNACRSACMSEPACRAWTFVRPGHQGPTPRCWLKNIVPPPQNAACCVSGVKQTPPPPPSIEYGIDRPGMDYKD
ncbi:MAG: apple domain-containing protein, partial [Candidatus Electrothrix sp. ATG2]|nr:apple domain-containing protein [Candidatus Electrothrix sp. ATG2]